MLDVQYRKIYNTDILAILKSKNINDLNLIQLKIIFAFG